MDFGSNLTKVFNHGSKTEVGIILRSCGKHNKLKVFTTLLKFNIEDFQPTGPLSTYKEKSDSEEEMKMPATPLRQMYNLRRYICHDSGYDEDEFDHPLSEPNWTSQTRGKYMRFHTINSTDTKDFKATSDLSCLVLNRTSRGKRVNTPHSKMRDTSMGSGEVSTSLQNHISVNKC